MDYLYNQECYNIIACCMEVHKQLGKGFSEIVYKDALEIEFRNRSITYGRELKYEITYKGNILPHYYLADFIIFNKIILEVKAIEALTSSHISQAMNYLAASGLELALLVNFGEDSLKYKRVILTKVLSKF